PYTTLFRSHEQNLRRTADPEPRDIAQRLVRQQPAAQGRRKGGDVRHDISKSGHSIPRDRRPAVLEHRTELNVTIGDVMSLNSRSDRRKHHAARETRMTGPLSPPQ